MALRRPDESNVRALPGEPVRQYPPDWNRILSLILAALWLALCAFGGGLEAVLKNAMMLVLPVACIWFADELGSLTTGFTGPISEMPITRESPGWLVRVFGWVALVALTVVRVLIVAALSP